MMEKNFFKEQIIKRQPSTKDLLMKIGIVLAAVVLSLASFTFLGMFGPVGVVVALFGAYWLWQRTNKEFEYVFTNGELDIDTIYNKSQRKRTFSCDIKDFQICAKVNDTQYANEFSRAEQTLDFSSNSKDAQPYAALLDYKGKKTKMIFEPNEKILEAMRFYIPRQLKWKKYVG